MKRAIFAIVGTVSGLILLLGFKTHPSPTANTAGALPVAPSVPADPSASATPKGGNGKQASAGPKTRTVSGDTIQTRFGPVQIQLTLTDGKITKVTALQLPNDRQRDLEIDNFAVPQLTQETLSAQNAQIDAVSGATYTSQGYIQSLQSALDKAGS
jgi:uncharacterized protein with FMN-binding domain